MMIQQGMQDEIGRYEKLCNRIRRCLDKPLRFPSLTEEQLAEIETQIGFRFPLALRLLYTKVADGGFGPGLSGLKTLAHGRQLWPVVSSVTHTGWRFDLETERALIDRPGTYVVCLDVPDGWLELCDIGCGVSYELDLYTGRIYEAGASSIPDDVMDEDLLNVMMQRECAIGIQFRSPSVEAFMEEWLDPPLVPKRAPQPRDRRSQCLGLAGSHGIVQVGYASSSHSEFEDDVEPHQNIDDLMSSADWQWYQRQPPADTED